MFTDVLFESEDTAEKTLKLLSPEETGFFRLVFAGRRPGNLSPDRFSLLLPFVLRESFKETVRETLEREDPQNILVRNVEELGMLNEYGFSGRMISDFTLYTFNRLSREAFRTAGISEDTVPLELNYGEIKERGAEGSAVVIYGRTPMMISDQCVCRNSEKCRKEKKGFYMELKDRKKAVFPVFCNCRYCHNIIYNSVPLSLINRLEFIESLKPLSVRVDITLEEPERAAEILRAVINRREEILKDGGYTYGHFRKGVE